MMSLILSEKFNKHEGYKEQCLVAPKHLTSLKYHSSSKLKHRRTLPYAGRRDLRNRADAMESGDVVFHTTTRRES